MAEEILSRVIAIVAEQAGRPPQELGADTRLEALGLDSIALVEVIFGLEEQFDISIPFNANEPEKSDFDISSMGTIIAAVERLIAERG